MKWVTWQHVMVDRMACAWLIKRQIDPQAEFIFIRPGAQPLPEGAEAFDIPGTRFSHHRGHCSFYAFLKEYQIKDPVLQQIARIVNCKEGELKEGDEVKLVIYPVASHPMDVKKDTKICERVYYAFERAK